MPRLDVVVVGDTAADVLLFGLPQELPIERELLVERMDLTVGGSAAITAHNLAALGSRTGFITPKADDLFGEMCHQQLTAAGVDLSRTVPSMESTGVTVMLQHAIIRRALTFPGNATRLRFQDLDLDYLCSARHFHLSSYFVQRELRDDVPRLFEMLKSAGLTISLDTNDDPWNEWSGSIAESLPFVDILLPNDREACRLAGTTDLEAAIQKLRGVVPTLVIKHGAAGASVHHGKTMHRLTGLKVESVDAVGAGDSFNAGFIAAYLQDRPLADCLLMGNIAGAFSTTRTGGTNAFRDREALASFLREHTQADAVLT